MEAEIFDAAETDLVEYGPAGPKFQVVADEAGLPVSNAFHPIGRFGLRFPATPLACRSATKPSQV